MNIHYTLCGFLLILFFSQQTKAATFTLPLWTNTSITTQNPNTVIKHGAVSHIDSPYLNVYTPKYNNHVAVMMISGGGYAREELAKESTPTSAFLQQHGFTVFELVYRLPNQDNNNALAPFQDGQRAIRIIRSQAERFHIDPEKIGVLGFSAGGHLAGMLATQWSHQFSTLHDSIDQVSAQPNFVALLYPVISMQPPLDHTHVYKSLMGKNHDSVKQAFFSVNLQVNQHTPPIFLAHALDDRIAPVQHSLDMQMALDKNKIPYELHLFKNGGHGWGLGKANTETTQWSTLFLTWLKNMNIVETDYSNKK
ncbi:alpha/beta hydrolase [Acinetobacter bereziniae]|uniref:alpha/beta hydrolase n=1 Tax=Acinetobacter bereziniae TaxID=106648 RepID=UPI0021D0D97B|nr:alpha/beta hydrolase [Acinetobacter bereziniae]MCU4435978.1 alpha/beta hydrolase [Acinetobacter bereziniae]